MMFYNFSENTFTEPQVPIAEKILSIVFLSQGQLWVTVGGAASMDPNC